MIKVTNPEPDKYSVAWADAGNLPHHLEQGSELVSPKDLKKYGLSDALVSTDNKRIEANGLVLTRKELPREELLTREREALDAERREAEQKALEEVDAEFAEQEDSLRQQDTNGAAVVDTSRRGVGEDNVNA